MPFLPQIAGLALSCALSGHCGDFLTREVTGAVRKRGAGNREGANSAANAVLRLLPSAGDAALLRTFGEIGVRKNRGTTDEVSATRVRFAGPLLTAPSTIRTL